MSGVVKFVAGAAVMFAGVFSGNLALAKAGYSLAMLGLLEEASKLFIPKARRPKYAGHDVEYAGTVMPRRILYGKMRIGGMNTIRPLVGGANGEFLKQVLTLVGHEVSAIPTVYFGETAIESAAMTAVTGTADDGKVTSGDYANIAWIRRYLGTAAQTVDFKLHSEVGGLWTAGHRGRNVAYLAIHYKLDQQKYDAGKPDVTAMVEAKKCYDPRLDTSPGANPTNTSYIAYTTNPALQLADYLTDPYLGRGVAAARIDWALVVAAANICDETVTIPGGTQARYTSSMLLEAAGEERLHEKNIQALAGAMMGVCYRQGGKWRMYAGAALTPSYTLTEADIVGDVSVRLNAPIGEAYNFVRGTYYDASRRHQESEFEPRSSATYETADGGRFVKSLDLPGCTNAYEAQRDAIIVLRRSRMRRTLSARFALSAAKVRPWIVGTMTFADIGWSAQRVVCTSWKFVGDGSIEMTLQEDAASIWDDPDVGDYSTPGSGGTGSSTGYVPGQPTGLTAKRMLDGIQFSWTPPAAMLPGDVFELLEYTSSTPLSSAVRVWEGRTSSAFVPKGDTTTRYYWVRTRAHNGNVSGADPGAVGLGSSALNISGTVSATPSLSSVTSSGTGTSQTTASVTVTPTGGTSPYTYSWSKVSGDTITADSSTAATTTFSATSLATGETRTATYRCTVTDNVAATATCDVVVSIARLGMSVSISPASSTTTTSSGTPVTSASVTATAANGAGGYTYAWVKLAGDNIAANSPSSATTTFTLSGLFPAGSTRSATFEVTATDSSANTATNTIAVVFERTGGA